ncbi:hypothetical protein SUGI_0205170 [Cryptomeria japonica]|nr:hypothetical protein SUGI_0205170 [Cryptomeria japonica]
MVLGSWDFHCNCQTRQGLCGTEMRLAPRYTPPLLPFLIWSTSCDKEDGRLRLKSAGVLWRNTFEKEKHRRRKMVVRRNRQEESR